MSATVFPPFFDAIFTILIGEEGGYTNNPNDPGGPTNWGISQAAFPNLDIKNLTQIQAKAIYLQYYWTPASCNLYPAPLALMVFDAAVNNGVERACEWLQAAVGVATDGYIGPQTTAALTACLSAADMGVNGVCAEFLSRRIDFMACLPTWQTFGLGWSRRLAALPYKALSLATTKGS